METAKPILLAVGGQQVNISVPPGALTNFGPILSGIVSWLLLIAFLLSFIYLVLGGLAWITSGGDKAGVEAARNKIIAAIVGLIIVASGWAIFSLIGGAIGFNPLQGGFSLPTLYQP